MEFTIFDHIYDSVLVYDKKGIVIYCNEAFSALSGVSPNRMIGKMDLSKAFAEIEGNPILVKDFVAHHEPTNTRVIRYKTRAVADGLAQFSIMPLVKDQEKLFIFVLRDLSVEEELHKKYRREMTLKDKKIEQMNSLIQLLQKTRLVKEPIKILEEFLKHILFEYSLPAAFIRDGEGQVYRVLEKIPSGYAASMNAMALEIEKMKPIEKYIYFEKESLEKLNFSNLQHVHSLLGVPVKPNSKAKFEIFIPVPTVDHAQSLDQDRISTLSQQMAMMIDNMTLEKLSIVDDLTKLYNARYFREKLDEYTVKYPVLSMILADIDHFKLINDTYGHPGGDTVLQRIGSILKQAVESENRENVVSRVGGEEFSILLPHKSPQEAAVLAEEIAEIIRAEIIPYGTKQIKLTMSFGVSAWSPGQISVRDFYTRTDQALYYSKRNGRNRITRFEEIPT